jgi:hypothetical protein
MVVAISTAADEGAVKETKISLNIMIKDVATLDKRISIRAISLFFRQFYLKI